MSFTMKMMCLRIIIPAIVLTVPCLGIEHAGVRERSGLRQPEPSGAHDHLETSDSFRLRRVQEETPTAIPTLSPTLTTLEPSHEITEEPTHEGEEGSLGRMQEDSPTAEPTHEIEKPTAEPDREPTTPPIDAPPGEPTMEPDSVPTPGPEEGPTTQPVVAPTGDEPTLPPTTVDECPIIRPPESTEECQGVFDPAKKDLSLCAGIRGNGPRVWAHFTALARQVEAFGPIAGTAGGSSGTISSFLLESIQQNPLVWKCSKDTCCDGLEQRARVSYLLKSIEKVPTWTVFDPSTILADIWSEIDQRDILPRLQSDDPDVQNEALEDLFEVFSLPDIAPFVNPELIELLQTSPDPIFHATDILTATSRGFTVGDDQLVFIRPYILNFEALADIVDLIASFYAGLAPVDLEVFEFMLQQCAIPSLGKEWNEIESIETSGGSTCADLFTFLYPSFVRTRSSSDPKRAEDLIGETTKGLISIGVLRGDAVPTWEQAVEDYEAVKPVTFDIDFSDVSFGYFGDEQSVDRATANIPLLFDDAKSEKFFPLGPVTWREALLTSPAEPTLSRGVPILNGAAVSVAGWNDPVPAQVLTSMGCDRSILINRPDGQGQFGLDIATLLGASPEDLDALYSLDIPDSGFVTALREANATYCADWDSQPPLNISGIANEGYIAPLLTDDACILSLDAGAVDDENIRGCTP